jgi:hypothetical protein
MKLCIFILSFLFITSIACAETYKWEDKDGVHYTDNPSTVPEKYRAKVFAGVEERKSTSSPIIRETQLPQNSQIVEPERRLDIERDNAERRNLAVDAMQRQQSLIKAQNALQAKQLNQAMEPLARFVTMWILFGLIAFVAWIAALVDILKSEFKNESNKIVWLLVIFFIPLLGALLYFLIASDQKSHGGSFQVKNQKSPRNDHEF